MLSISAPAACPYTRVAARPNRKEPTTNPQDSRRSRSVRRGADEVWSFDTVTAPPHPGRQDLRLAEDADRVKAGHGNSAASGRGVCQCRMMTSDGGITIRTATEQDWPKIIVLNEICFVTPQ